MVIDNRDRALPPVPIEPLRETDPRELGDFRLLGRLGSGGMGVAFLADGQGQWAVVKMIRSDLADDRTFRARLSRELDAMKLAGSQTTAQLLAAEPYASPAWFAMEFIPGVTLARRVEDSGPLPMSDVQSLARDLAVVLAHLHEVGITHRDIKPGNIMLSPDGPKIIDFGIADLAEGTALTRTGVVLGSTGWLAPEQVKGDEVTPATDVHAWALSVLFAATAQAPFGADTTTAAIYRVLEHSPDVPDDVPEPLHDLLARALDKEPAGRPTMPEVVAALAEAPVEDAVPVVATAGAVAATTATRPVPPPAPAAPAEPAPADGSRKGPNWLVIGLAAAALLVVIVAVVAFVATRSGGTVAADATSTVPAAATTPPAAPTTAAPTPTPPRETSAPPSAAVPSTEPTPSDVPSSPPGEVTASRPSSTASAEAPADVADVALVPLNTPLDDFAQPFAEDVPIPPAKVKGTNRLVGDTYALYAGNRMEKEATCDRSRLSDYFETSPSEAAVFADEMGVPVDGIREALYAMTPVVLRTDTLVTLHGISLAGEPTTMPVVLQAGTSILAGKSGVPRMRCYGGNPLSGPPDVTADTTVGGDGWELFDPGTIVIITAANKAINPYYLVNIDTDRMFTRKAGTHGTDDAILNKRPPASIP